MNSNPAEATRSPLPRDRALPTALAAARLTITPKVIAAYAELTDDYNPIHLDPVFAAGTAMGGVIAHGTMSIGLIWRALERSGLGALVEGATLDIRFVKPVRIGETLCGGGVLSKAEDEHAARSYDVWVRCEQDGQDRLSGKVLLPHHEGMR